MAETNRRLILKLLSGTQEGAEVALADGVYSFGSGESADIRIIDIAMPELQGRIRIEAGRISLQAVGTSLVAASGLVIEPGGEDWREIAQLDVVTAGTTRFALGESGAGWADLLAPAPPAADRRDRRDRRRLSGLAAPAGLNWKLSSGALAALLLLGVAGYAMQSGDRAAPAPESLSLSAEVAQLRGALAGLPFPTHLEVAAEADGRVIVQGYVRGAAERRAVENALLDTGLPLRRRIWDLDVVQADIEGLIGASGADVQVSLTDEGVAVLTGSHLDVGETEHLVAMIRAQVFGLADVDDRILTARSYLQQVEELLDRLSLSSLVIVRLDGPLVEATGIVPAGKADSWVGFIQAYASRFADVLPLRSYVTLENRPPERNAEPLVVGDSAVISGLGGRKLSSQSLREGATALGPQEVFGPGPEEGAPSPVQDTPPAGPAGEALPVASNQRVPPMVASVIADYAQTNPGIVDAIVNSVTGGQFSSLGALQAGEATPRAETRAAPLGASDASGTIAGILRAGDGEGRADPVAGGTGAAETAGEVAGTAGEVAGTAGEVAGTAGEVAGTQAAAGASAGGDYERFSTGFRDRGEVADMMKASEGLFAQPRAAGEDSRAVTLSGLAEERLPGLGALSPELLDLAQRQAAALAVGSTLLRGPRPLSALPYRDEVGRASCWEGASLRPEALPAIMLWLDILSLGGDADLSGFEPEARIAILEAALSPDRLRSCLQQERNAYGTRLMTASSYLRETERNSRFVEYIVRETPRFPLMMSGADLSGERYVVLENGVRLGEGAAPTLDSRILAIGDLGVLLRTSAGLQVALYPERMKWFVRMAGAN